MDVLIVDYSMGNLRSVENAFAALGANAVVSADPAQLEAAPRIVLPGVGAFADGMANLRAAGWIEPLERAVLEQRRPFLGLCLGMQLLAAEGWEHGRSTGLGWIPGRVTRLAESGLRVPHVGWNDVEARADAVLYRDLGDRESFYFVHSYVFEPEQDDVVSGVCTYGEAFAASLEDGNVHATQYHPEKSQRAGLAVLRSFLAQC